MNKKDGFRLGPKNAMSESMTQLLPQMDVFIMQVSKEKTKTLTSSKCSNLRMFLEKRDNTRKLKSMFVL